MAVADSVMCNPAPCLLSNLILVTDKFCTVKSLMNKVMTDFVGLWSQAQCRNTTIDQG